MILPSQSRIDGAKIIVEACLNKHVEKFDREQVGKQLETILTKYYKKYHDDGDFWFKPKINVDFNYDYDIQKNGPSIIVDVSVHLNTRGTVGQDTFRYKIWPKNFKELCN